MCTKRPTPASRAAAIRFRVPSTMIRWNCSARPCRIATRWTTVSQPSTAARSVSGFVTSPSHDLAAPRLEALAGLAPVADERAHRPVVGAERVDDVSADEAVRARDEDHVVDSPTKFCQ